MPLRRIAADAQRRAVPLIAAAADSMAERKPSRHLGLSAIAVLVVAFGAVTELRSAFLTHRHTDAGIYFRAAWAVQSGDSIYEATDDNGWHYHYPPLLAIVLLPLADPPPGAPPGPFVPYAISIALWYAIGAAALIWGVRWMARAIEASAGLAGLRAPPFTAPWWTLRLIPCAVCLVPLGHTLGRGQVGTIVLLCVAGMFVSLLKQHRGRAGLWLAAAICLKVFPAYLLLYPAWRRDWRCLAACASGLLIGLVVIPAAVLGPGRTVAAYGDFYRVVLGGVTMNAADPSTADEFYHERAGDLMSLRSVLFKTLHPDPATRPQAVDAWYDTAQKLIGLSLTILMLAALGRPESARAGPRAIGPPDSAVTTVLALGLMLVAVIPLIPVSQPHYYMLALPLVMGLIADDREHRGGSRPSRPLSAFLVLYAVANLLPYLPGLYVLMDLGLDMYAGLVLWLFGLVVLWRRHVTPTAVRPDGEAPVPG
jgi:hypothetical protein